MKNKNKRWVNGTLKKQCYNHSRTNAHSIPVGESHRSRHQSLWHSHWKFSYRNTRGCWYCSAMHFLRSSLYVLIFPGTRVLPAQHQQLVVFFFCSKREWKVATLLSHSTFLKTVYCNSLQIAGTTTTVTLYLQQQCYWGVPFCTLHVGPFPRAIKTTLKTCCSKHSECEQRVHI